MRARVTTVLCALLAALALAACGEDREETGTTSTSTTGTAAEPAGEPAATLALEESDFKISPADARVDTSGLVRIDLVNTGDTEHALEVETPEGERETEPFAPGETASLEVLLEPGEYKMYCPVGDHEERGMTGTITVAGDPGGATTTEEPPDSSGGY